MIRMLFICNDARSRGPTASQIASQLQGVRADCAGLNNEADDLISVEQLEWANIIFVMEPRQKSQLQRSYSEAVRGKQIINLDVPDLYSFMAPELVEILSNKIKPYAA
ncbi:MAG: phosphotyrosine protein phosphatase [Hyphomicrobiales bacterium]|nr:phosphotyrosine protein phosphatase [Hyphomicrobiales bacterium]